MKFTSILNDKFILVSRFYSNSIREEMLQLAHLKLELQEIWWKSQLQILYT